ncbi:hypothetical protein DMENIID0001_155510 [Sergentomyia squamirostris]
MIADKATSQGLKEVIIVRWMTTNLDDPELFLRRIIEEEFSPDEVAVGVYKKCPLLPKIVAKVIETPVLDPLSIPNSYERSLYPLYILGSGFKLGTGGPNSGLT